MLGIGKLIARSVNSVLGGAAVRGLRTAGAVATLTMGQTAVSSSLAAASFPSRGPIAGLMAGSAKALTSVGTASAEGVSIAREMLFAVKDRVAGAYIMPPFGRYELAVEVIDGIVR